MAVAVLVVIIGITIPALPRPDPSVHFVDDALRGLHHGLEQAPNLLKDEGVHFLSCDIHSAQGLKLDCQYRVSATAMFNAVPEAILAWFEIHPSAFEPFTNATFEGRIILDLDPCGRAGTCYPESTGLIGFIHTIAGNAPEAQRRPGGSVKVASKIKLGVPLRSKLIEAAEDNAAELRRFLGVSDAEVVEAANALAQATSAAIQDNGVNTEADFGQLNFSANVELSCGRARVVAPTGLLEILRHIPDDVLKRVPPAQAAVTVLNAFAATGKGDIARPSIVVDLGEVSAIHSTLPVSMWLEVDVLAGRLPVEWRGDILIPEGFCPTSTSTTRTTPSTQDCNAWWPFGC